MTGRVAKATKGLTRAADCPPSALRPTSTLPLRLEHLPDKGCSSGVPGPALRLREAEEGSASSHFPSPTHLGDGYHIRVGVEQEGGEFGVGAWPGQHGHHTAGCHLGRARREVQCRRRCPGPPPLPTQGPGSPPLSDSPGPAGGLSPQGRPRQPLRTESEGCSASQALPRPLAQAGLGAHPERGADPKPLLPPQHISTSETPASRETPAFLPPGGSCFWPISDPLYGRSGGELVSSLKMGELCAGTRVTQHLAGGKPQKKFGPVHSSQPPSLTPKGCGLCPAPVDFERVLQVAAQPSLPHPGREGGTCSLTSCWE